VLFKSEKDLQDHFPANYKFLQLEDKQAFTGAYCSHLWVWILIVSWAARYCCIPDWKRKPDSASRTCPPMSLEVVNPLPTTFRDFCSF